MDPDNKIVAFRRHNASLEHADDSTIVERIEMTDELKQLFIENGYDFDDEPPPEAA